MDTAMRVAAHSPSVWTYRRNPAISQRAFPSTVRGAASPPTSRSDGETVQGGMDEK